MCVLYIVILWNGLWTISTQAELQIETCNCILNFYATQMALCPFWISLSYFLFPLNYCKQRASLLTSKAILTWDQLPRTLGKMTNGFLLLGKMFVVHHTNIFTDEIFSSVVAYLFFFIKFSQVKKSTRLTVKYFFICNIPNMVKNTKVMSSVVLTHKSFYSLFQEK